MTNDQLHRHLHDLRGQVNRAADALNDVSTALNHFISLTKEGPVKEAGPETARTFLFISETYSGLTQLPTPPDARLIRAADLDAACLTFEPRLAVRQAKAAGSQEVPLPSYSQLLNEENEGSFMLVRVYELAGGELVPTEIGFQGEVP